MLSRSSIVMVTFVTFIGIMFPPILILLVCIVGYDLYRKKDKIDNTYKTRWVHKDEFKAYYRSRHWKQKRLNRLKIDNYLCQHCFCDLKSTEAHVHHKTYKRFKSEPMDDLISLCKHCHQIEHGREFN